MSANPSPLPPGILPFHAPTPRRHFLTLDTPAPLPPPPMPQNLHPNSRAYRVYRDAIIAHIAAALGRDPAALISTVALSPAKP